MRLYSMVRILSNLSFSHFTHVSSCIATGLDFWGRWMNLMSLHAYEICLRLSFLWLGGEHLRCRV